jgi:hypothetical protein
MNKRLLIPLFAVLFAISMVACDVLKGQNGVPKAAADPSTQETLVALSVIQTQLAAPSPTAAPPTAVPIAAVPTTAPTETLPPTLTTTPLPTPTQTFTPVPTDTPTAIPTATQTATNTPVPGIADRIKSANILIYEDLGNANLVPRISKGIELLNLSGGQVVNTHNNLASFITNLNSPTAWDLVIIDAESRDIIHLGSLGVYNQVVRHVENGGGLIVEAWNLDEDSSDLASYIEDKCALRVEKNWVRQEGTTNIADFALYNLNQGVPVFDTPYKINLPMLPTIYWNGDIGDLMSKNQGSNALFATGLSSKDPTRYGLLSGCAGGRLLLQTFSTHDYRLFETTELWANYVHYVLTNHFSQPAK